MEEARGGEKVGLEERAVALLALGSGEEWGRQNHHLIDSDRYEAKIQKRDSSFDLFVARGVEDRFEEEAELLLKYMRHCWRG